EIIESLQSPLAKLAAAPGKFASEKISPKIGQKGGDILLTRFVVWLFGPRVLRPLRRAGMRWASRVGGTYDPADPATLLSAEDAAGPERDARLGDTPWRVSEAQPARLF